MAIQMRRGLLSAYDKDKMLAGEWGIAIDADTDNQKAYVAFAPGVDKEVMFVDDAEAQIAQATSAAITDATNKAAALVHGNAYTVNDYASGDGTTKAFTLTETPTSITAVYVDGEATTAYTRSGSTITFTTAPPAGTNNIHVVYSVSTATDNALYYKNQASQYASNASSSASSASGSASTATNKANAASSSATAAATSEDNAEAWAVGQINGTDVGSSDARYHNNSKYYSQQSANSAAEAAASAASLDVETILGDFAKYEPEATASYSHTKDKYLIWSDSKLYKVTADIDVGETIAKGTNIASNPTTVGDEVAAINSDLTKKAIGGNLATEIPANSDLNTYTTPGMYCIASDTDAATISNVPRASSGRLAVISNGSSRTDRMTQIYFPTSGILDIAVRIKATDLWSDWGHLVTYSSANKIIVHTGTATTSGAGTASFSVTYNSSEYMCLSVIAVGAVSGYILVPYKYGDATGGRWGFKAVTSGNLEAIASTSIAYTAVLLKYA